MTDEEREDLKEALVIALEKNDRREVVRVRALLREEAERRAEEAS